jgi:hypothetical protein
MNKRSKLAALLGAGLLTFAVASIALADTLRSPEFAGKALGDLTLGTPTDCLNQFGTLDEGEAGVFFVLGGADQADGTLDATFSNPASTPHLDSANFKEGNSLRWAVTVTGDADTVIESASTNATSNAAGDDNLVISHVCFGAAAPSSTPTITGEPNTDTIGSSGQSGPTDTAWLLVVALGVLLASIVVLTPARAKSRR